MWTKGEEIDGRNRHKLAGLRPKCLQDRFGFYAHSPSKLSIEPGYSFRRLAKVLILNVHAQFLQQQFHDLRQAIALRSRRFEAHSWKHFFWRQLEPILQMSPLWSNHVFHFRFSRQLSPYVTIPYLRSDQEATARSLVSPFRVLPQTASRMECTCFNSGHGQTEPSSGFGTCKLFQFAKKSHDSQAFPET